MACESYTQGRTKHTALWKSLPALGALPATTPARNCPPEDFLFPVLEVPGKVACSVCSLTPPTARELDRGIAAHSPCASLPSCEQPPGQGDYLGPGQHNECDPWVVSYMSGQCAVL